MTATVESILIYESEAWTLTATHKKGLEGKVLAVFIQLSMFIDLNMGQIKSSMVLFKGCPLKLEDISGLLCTVPQQKQTRFQSYNMET